MSALDDIRKGSEGIKNIIAVASGKGGVGKSTVTANLAIALAKKGYKTAVVDADIYGPTMPSFFGIFQRPVMEDNKLIPVEKNGVKIMSIGFMLDDYSAVIWRGPMIMGAIKQFIADTNWGDIDIMLIDLPPGTGDAPLTICQALPLKGGLIVSTPQAAAAKTAARAADLFRQMNVPVIGAVLNMSYLICESCGKKNTVFPASGAALLKNEAKLDIIAELPFYDGFMEETVPGEVRHIENDKAAAAAFDGLADKVVKACVL